MYRHIAHFANLTPLRFIAAYLVVIFHVEETGKMFDHAVVTPLLMMAIFAWFIVNAAVNERSIVRLDSRLFNYLGDIS